jgi:hypothetical protein
VLVEGKANQDSPARLHCFQRGLSTATRWPCTFRFRRKRRSKRPC